MANIKERTKFIWQAGPKVLPLKKSLLPEISSVQHNVETPSLREKAVRVSKFRYADSISEGQVASGKADDHDHHHGDQKVIKRCQEVLENLREPDDHIKFLKMKKHRKIDIRGEADDKDDHRYFKKRRGCSTLDIEKQRDDDHVIKKNRSSRRSSRKMKTQRGDADRKLKRRQEIEKQREAARIAINKVTKTVDFDNLCVMAEFKRLLHS